MTTLNGDSTNNVLAGTSSSDSISGGGGDDAIYAGAGSDTVSGGSGDDVIYAGAGNDSVSGGSGSDYVDGGAGNDVIDGGAGNDMLFGGAGSDLIYGGSGSDWIEGGIGNDLLFGGAGSDTIFGGEGNDVIEGGAGDDAIYGQSGNDVLLGGSGNDYVDGGTGRDIIVGGGGHDVLLGNRGNDVMDGSGGDDVLSGGDGNDALFGGSGNDTLIGGAGVDYLHGGSGSDVFVFEDASDSSAAGSWDRIVDFQQGRDKIDLSALLGSGNLAFGAKLQMANGVSYSNGGSSTFIHADVNGDGVDDFKVELLNASELELNASDFIGASEANNSPVLSDTTDPAAVLELVNASTQDLEPIIGSFSVTDLDMGDTLSASVVGSPTVLLNGEAFTLPAGASALTADGAFTVMDAISNGGAASIGFSYGPAAANLDFLSAGDSLTITYAVSVNDGTVESGTQDVTFTIIGTNDAPVATSEMAIGSNDGVEAGVDAKGFLLDNVNDPDNGDRLTFTGIDGLVGDPAHGLYGNATLLDEDTGEWIYALNSAGIDRLNKGLDVDDSFEYTVKDLAGAGSSSTLAIHIDSTVIAPVVTSDTSSSSSSSSTDSGSGDNSSDPVPQEESSPAPAPNSQPASANDNVITGVSPGDQVDIPVWALLANDTNANGNPVGIESVGGTSNGDMVSFIGGNIAFTDADEFAASSFTYVANYGSSSGNPVTVTVSQDVDGVLDGTAGSDVLIGARYESTTFVGSEGDDVLIGGHYSDTFDYNALSDRGAAGDVISGFQKGSDNLDLHDLLATLGGFDGSNAFSGGYLRFEQSGSDTLVQVDGNGGSDSFETLATVLGVQLDSTDTGDFIL